MTKVISFISRKGGTGKTTNAIHLSTMLFSLGYKLSLVETDTNYTLSTLRKIEIFKTGAKEDSVFKILGSTDADIIADLQSLKAKKKEKLDFVIVDSAGKTTDQHIRNLCIESNLVIVPTSLTQNDLLVTYQTIEDLKPALDANPNLKILVLPNRINSRTALSSIQKSLENLKVNIAHHFVPMRNVYTQFSTIIPEKEYQSITSEVINYLQEK
jgi:chromosome partitioning protein